MSSFGSLLIVLGAVLIIIGALSLAFPGIGKLPGDISFSKGSWSVYIPVTTSILVSILLTLLFWLFARK